jgi:hypothetical protein
VNYTQLKQLIQDYTQNYETTFVADIPTFVEQAEQRIYNSVQFPSLRKNMTGSITQYNQYLATPTDFLAPYSLAIYQTATTTATGTSGAYTITVTSGNNITLGQIASGTGIAQGALVVGINGLVLTLNLPNTGTVSGSVSFQGNFLYLLNKDVNFIREVYGNSIAYGTPQYYALFGPTVSSGAITNELTFILGPTPDSSYTAELHYYYYPVSIADTVNNPSGTSWLGDNFDTVLLYGSLVEAYTFMKGETDMMTLYNQKYVEALALAKRLGDGMERQDAYRTPQFRQAVT